MTDLVKITVTENGPLKISHSGATVRYMGKPVVVDAAKPMVVCRCGQSANAPFCDGSHARTGFVGAPGERGRKELKVWEGKTIRTFFNPNVCMHVFYCKPLNDLRERELAGEAAAATEIARVVQSCPSGALSFESKDVDVDVGEPADRADIDIMDGGEVRIQCAFEINAELQERQPADRATLCRCGLSNNKPWCDGRHKGRQDFR